MNAIATSLDSREIPPHELLARGPQRLIVRVQSIIFQGEDLNEYELVDPEGKPLPPFTAGSHIDLYFRDGRIRQYSLCNAETERHHYRIVVQRDSLGRGGSKAIFERVHVGRLLVISYPRNNFALAPGSRHLLIAGGIGITPLLSMLYSLDASNQPFELHYCTRSPERTAFKHELDRYIRQSKVILHHDEGDPSRGLDVRALLAAQPSGTLLYYCGPSGFMRAISALAADWPPGTVHFESFAPPLDESTSATSAFPQFQDSIPVGFEIKIASSGRVIEVPNDKTILQVLRENAVEVPSSCESGLCGTCKVHYKEGAPDHRDYILDDLEKEHVLLVCCSRSKTPMLVLDL